MAVNKAMLIMTALLLLLNTSFLYYQYKALKQAEPVTMNTSAASETDINKENIRLTKLEARLDDLSNEFLEITVNLNKAVDNATKNSKQLSKLTMASLEYQSKVPHQPPVLTDSIENILDLGVLDEDAWQAMEHDIASMSKQENKAFWQKVLAKIEQDAFLIADYQD